MHFSNYGSDVMFWSLGCKTLMQNPRFTTKYTSKASLQEVHSELFNVIKVYWIFFQNGEINSHAKTASNIKNKYDFFSLPALCLPRMSYTVITSSWNGVFLLHFLSDTIHAVYKETGMLLKALYKLFYTFEMKHCLNVKL